MNKIFEKVAAIFIFPYPFPKEDKQPDIHLIVS